MVINSSAVGMAAKSAKRVKYTQTNQTAMSNVQTGEKRFTENSFEHTYESSLEGKMYREDNGNSYEPLVSESYNKQGIMNEPGISNAADSVASSLNDRKRDSVQEVIAQLKFFLLSFRSRLTMFIGRRSLFGGLYDGSRMTGGILDISSGGSVSVWNRVNYSSCTYEEEETMTFETTGQVVTADGRNIDFNMQVEMSREFSQTSEVLTNDTTVIMTDPLVISLDSNPVSVSDQKWKFDIDGDGETDNISLLSKGSGFLAFDKNRDGIINDGMELFGAATGNGFSELEEYDDDGNGWIDENDSIYSKLSVWLKDDSGNDRMISLKDANVGAIYLASMTTEFSLNSDEGNKQNAQIKRSGMYLTENGTAGTMQQLDMVKALIS